MKRHHHSPPGTRSSSNNNNAPISINSSRGNNNNNNNIITTGHHNTHVSGNGDNNTTVESCYSIDSLQDSSVFGSAQECKYWRVLVTLFLITIACGVIILVTAAKSPSNGPNTGDDNSSPFSSNRTESTVHSVKFEYNEEGGGGTSSSAGAGQQVLSEFVFLYKLPPPIDLDASSDKSTSNTQHHHHHHHHHRFSTAAESSRHHYYNTGVFRPRGSRLWDPHPQYIFHAFNKRFHVVLNQISKKHSLLVPGFHVTTHKRNNNNAAPPGKPESWVTRDSVVSSSSSSSKSSRVREDEFEGCFYNGYVLGDMESSVAVSLCNGMTGHIRTSSGSYFIEPRRYSGNELQHEIYVMVSQAHDDTIDLLGDLQQNSSPLTTLRPHHAGSSRNNSSGLKRNNNNNHHHSNNLKITTTYDYYSDEDYDSAENSGEEGKKNNHGNVVSRAKRSLSTERYVELTVVTDQTMSRYHGDNLKHYVLTLLSIVALVYRDASIGNPVNIVLVNFHVLTDTDFSGAGGNTAAGGVANGGSNSHNNNSSGVHGTSASEMLRNFCKWQKEHNHPDDRNALHHDTALLLTRETICRNPWVGKCDTLGLAELGTMCDHYASCAIVQDNGLSAAFTIAHELGHVMNMPHDDDYKCQGFVERNGVLPSSSNNDLSDGSIDGFDEDEEDGVGGKKAGGVQHYVMSRMLDHNTYPWAWSRCSRHFLTEFLDAGHGYCLEDKPDSNLLYNDDENSVDESLSSNGIQQPGEVFSEHKQCEFVFGPNSQLCSYMPPCRRLWCTNHGGPESEESEGCRTQHMPWADGTRCGANKWCQRGACVLKDLEKLKVVNGGWGNWQEYGECSRTCGGGVRKSYRECDNPKPKNGGKYCVGPRVRYESCNTFECYGNSTDDFRAGQCGAYDGDNFNIHGLPEDVAWVPKYNGISPKDRCKLFCRVQGSSSYYLLKEKVIDGTPCGLDTFDVCVNGACLPAGCDRRLHSTSALDICGVCGGDGSTCTTTQGSYNSTKYGYNAVIRIPSGASNIDIRQRSYDNSARDDNYLALLDPIANEYVLNGHFVVSMFRKTIHFGGSILEYSGSDQIVERINSSSRPIKRDLEVRVLSVGKLKHPDIVFQYVISSDQVVSSTTSSSNGAPERDSFSFEWVGKRAQNEQACSNVCAGVTVPYRNYECVRRRVASPTASPSVNSQPHQVVDGHYCSGVSRPAHQPQACNSHCSISYRLTCPDSCIHARNYTTECIRTLHSTNTTQRISEKYCEKSGVEKPDPPDCVSECRNKKARWRFTQWSDCSVSSVVGRCGAVAGSGGGNSGGSDGNGTTTGYQMRKVWCQRFNWRSLVESGVDNFEVVDDSECEGEKPVGRRGCRVAATNQGFCGEWKIDQWSPCSTKCGPGRTRALYACVLKTHSQVQFLPPDYCAHIPNPVVERPCEVLPCGSYETSNWSECDCGTSLETRNVSCHLNGVPQPESTSCEKLNVPRPEGARDCVTLRGCEAFEYKVSNWTADCRLFNGDGKYYRYRQVSCDGRCVGVEPENKRECGEWKVESGWSGCNGSCSLGVEVRSVGCYVGAIRASDFECEGVVGISRPVSERQCFHNCRSSDARMVRGQEGVGGGVSDRGGSSGASTSSSVSSSVGATDRNSGDGSVGRIDRYWYNVNVSGGANGGSTGGTGAEGVKPSVAPYKWSTGNWMKCTRMTTPKSSSSSCVPSTTHPRSFKKHRQVKCVAETTPPSRRTVTVPTAFCPTPAPESSVNCSSGELGMLQACPIWVVSEWGSCGVSQDTVENCVNGSHGGSILHGFKRRDVVCVHDTTNATVHDSACEAHVPKPEWDEKCVVRGGASNVRVCTNVTFGWRVGNWSGCVVEGGSGGGGGKKKCGQAGRKARVVECLRKWGKFAVVVTDDYCIGKRKGKRGKGAGGPKPKHVRDCVKACGGGGGNNSLGGGTGASERGGERGAGGATPTGKIKQPFKWILGEWSNCSGGLRCGYGLQSRRVTCHRTNQYDWTDPDPLPTQITSANATNYCVPPKPKEYDYCESCNDSNSSNNNNAAAPSYSWAYTDYSECLCPEVNLTTSSGQGAMTPTTSFQKRKVFCKSNTTSQKTPARHCAPQQKPKRKRKCECNAYRTCEEMRVALTDRLIEVQDGEYTLNVGGRNGVRVYCHGMTDLSQSPREYVTVTEEHNWSEIYDKRLIRPETCPRNGSRLSSCECVNDRNRRVGVTRWKRIRVNVTNLRVDVDDYTFAYSTQDQIAYGTAGDCYSSSMNCPQGRFSIDLRSTGFAVSPVTTWTTTGHRATMRITRKSFGQTKDSVSQYVQGKCGGYCASCTVSTAIGLRMEVN